MNISMDQVSAPTNYIEIIQDFNEAWNAHDPYKVAEFFSDDGYVKVLPPPPGNQLSTWNGKEQILAFVQSQIPNFHVEASNITQQSNKLIWDFSVTGDIFAQLGVSPASGTSEAVFEGNKIKSFILTFSPETVTEMMKQAPPKPS